MRQQYHFKQMGPEVYIWDVDKLISASKSLPVIEVDLADIKELNQNYWFQYAEDIPTCKSICEHFILMNETDLKHPIILNADGSVMDGMHRVCKAYVQKKKTIKAVRFRTMPEPHFKNKHPDELTY